MSLVNMKKEEISIKAIALACNYFPILKDIWQIQPGALASPLWKYCFPFFFSPWLRF